LFPHVGKRPWESRRGFDTIPQVLSILGGMGGFFGVHQYFHILDTSELATPFGVGELLPHVGDLYFPFPRWFAKGDGIFDKGSVRW
jgi:hypothetical protein